MKNERMASVWMKYCFLVMLGALLLLFRLKPVQAQALSVYTVQNLSFGAFFQGTTGGTVTVGHDGSRIITGDIIGANFGVSYFPVIIEVEVASGSLISILNGADATLNGSNGGSMTLSLGDSDLGTPFNTTAEPPARTSVKIGASLNVGSPAANPSGSYTGTFDVTFMVE